MSTKFITFTDYSDKEITICLDKIVFILSEGYNLTIKLNVGTTITIHGFEESIRNLNFHILKIISTSTNDGMYDRIFKINLRDFNCKIEKL